MDDEPLDDDLDPREAARTRRRDRDAGAEDHALMRSGMGKVFKQITDSWGRKASRPQKPSRKPTGKEP